jgi:hypothetical protein
MQGYLTLALTGIVLTMNVLGLCFTLYHNRCDQAASDAAQHHQYTSWVLRIVQQPIRHLQRRARTWWQEVLDQRDAKGPH